MSLRTAKLCGAQAFVNNYLVVDLGSVHAAETGSVVFSQETAATVGMSLGEVYNLDVFYAERRSAGAWFADSSSLVSLTLTLP